MRIRVFAFGKLKNPGFRESADYYLRNLQPFVATEEVELKPARIDDKSPAERTRVQQLETEAFTQRLGGASSTPLILLDERGKAQSTQAWADLLRQLEAGGTRELVFGIGSSLGFSEALRSRARAILSFGPQTLPHELARVVLYEQIYRAFTVLRGHPYHNEA